MSQKVDARSAYPKWKSDGKSLKSIINKYDDVLSGKVTAVKVDEKTLKKFKAVGYETSRGRVLVPHDQGETAKKVAGGRIVIKNKSGLERIQIPVEFHNLGQWFADIKKNKRLIDSMLSNGEVFGFRYFGYNSAFTYRNIELIVEDIEKYESTIAALPGTGRRKKRGDGLYKNIEIIRISKGVHWSTPDERHAKHTKQYQRRAEKKWRKFHKHDEKYMQRKAEQQRKYRANLKGAQLTEYKKKARKRAKKSRAKK